MAVSRHRRGAGNPRDIRAGGPGGGGKAGCSRHRRTRPAEGRGRSVRRVALAMLRRSRRSRPAAPARSRGTGTFKVRKVNLGGPPSDVFQFKIEKTPNLYEDIWQPGYKTFDLFGASSAAGPWIERTGSRAGPAGRQPGDLQRPVRRPRPRLQRLGQLHGDRGQLVTVGAQQLHDDGHVFDRRRHQVDDRQPGHGAVREVVLHRR